MKISEQLDQEGFYRLDTEGIGTCLEQFPKQCAAAFSLPQNLSKQENAYEELILCGMGGSALAGAVLRDLGLQYGGLPMYLHRSYGLPAFACEKSLVVLLSYSGNTEETLSDFAAAQERGCDTVAATVGGRLEEVCKKKGLPLISLPTGYPPRMATLFMAFSLGEWLRCCGLLQLPHAAYGEAYFRLGALKAHWRRESPVKENRAKITALQLYQKTPLIWGSEGVTTAAVGNLKNQLNETAKVAAYSSFFPEMNHNEIMVLKEQGKDCGVFVFRNPYEHPRVAKRFSLCKALLKDKVAYYGEYFPQPLAYLTTVAESLYFGNWVAYYLAALCGKNPMEIEEIEALKARMAH